MATAAQTLRPRDVATSADAAPSRRGAPLVLAGLSKRYAETIALAPTDLEVHPGEFFSLIGPSGSGKSTLLGAVAGFVTPSTGRILVNGANIATVPPYKRNIGMVFQNYSLFPHMSVADNIAFPLRMRKAPRGETQRRVQQMLDIVRLPGLGDRSPAQLSGGQQQRVALARAAVYDPPLLLMDEPLGALDKNLREEMQFEIKQFHAKIGTTILYVTHDQDEAASMSDRIAILDHGRIVQTGEPRELYEAPRNAFVASFLGEANLFRVVAARETTDGVILETEEGVPLRARAKPGWDGTTYACIRPEAIAIAESPASATKGLDADIVDVVYTAGTVRYRARVGNDAIVTVRLPSQRQAELLCIGRKVRLVWDSTDTLLVPEH